MTSPDPFDTLRAAAQAAADEGQRLEATVSGMQAALDAAAAQHTTDEQTIAAQAAEIAALEAEVNPQPQPNPQPAARFPGDPGSGKIVVGAIVSGGGGTADAFEQANHTKLGAHRQYWSAGISDLAAGGTVRKYIVAEHAAGRLPIVSIKLDWTQTVAGAYDAAIADFRTWVETLAKVVILIVNHEPENDGQPAPLYRQEQQHVRNVIGRGLKRLAFYGSLMGYDWAAASGRTPDDWFPGNAADGQPTWDACGVDQYAQTSGNPIEDAKFQGAVASLKKWGVPPAWTELGVRASDPAAGSKLAQLYADSIGLGFVLFCYYDSTNNSTQNGWVLTGAELTAFVALCNDPRSVRPAA